PFVGLFGTVFGIINAFRGMKNAESAGIAAVAGGISEALFTTALGLVVAVPAVWLFNYFTGKVDGFIVEMDNSASELVDYFIKNPDEDQNINKESAVIVSIPKDGEYWLAKKKLNLDDLKSQVEKSLANKKEEDKIVYIKSGVEVSYGEVVKVINAVREKGVDK